MSHLTSRAAIRQGLLVWLLVALCCTIPHCRMFSTYQEHEIETPLPVLLMNLAIHCKVPKEHTWESFREVVGSLLLRRQLGPDFNKCLLYCMMENMKMFGPDRTTLDPISSVRHAGPYLENYDQEKMIKCIDQVNLMEFKDNARARCDRSAIFLTCFNKGIFRLSWEHLLMEAAERCKKKLGIQSSLETGVIDSFVHRKLPDEVFPECLLHCMLRELGMTDNSNERMLDRDRALERVGYFFEEGDKRKMRECVDQANAIVLHSKFSHCERAKHFLTCFNRDTTMYTLELMLVEASYDCQEPTKAGLGEAILVVHSIIKRIKPGKKFPSCLLYCMFRVIGMISDEYLFNNETSQEYVGYFYEQLDRGKMGECIAKDLLGKAKKKILKLDEDLFTSDTEQSQPQSNLSAGYRSFDSDPQTIGVSRSHTRYFREVRNTRVERYAAETNKLLIRLDKLLSDLPTDPVKRKAHEQAVVPWIDDKDVRLCPSCAKTFHMARRKHHCRLCGAVMCHDCTHFLPLAIAKKMTIPSFHHDTPGPGPNAPQSPVNQGVGLLRRSNSNSSLNSVLSLVDSVTGEQHFRLCIHCKQLLDTREKLKESRTAKPILSQFYDRLRAYLSETDELLAQYGKMCNSLNCGESTYHLEDAQRLRVKVLKLAESIDLLSNKIAVLGTKDVDHPPRGKALKLQQTIRSATTTYLKEQLITLPTLPTEQQLNVLRDRRRQEMTNRILQEKRRTLEAQTRAGEVRGKRNSQSPQNSSSPQRSSGSPQRSVQVTLDAGWGPETAQMFDSDDPMIQQMNIIRNYIKQARTAHKYDEVSTLEQNLRELQEEYHRQQAETLVDGDS